MNEQQISNFIPVIVAFIGFLGVLTGAIFGYLGKSKKQAVVDAIKEQKQQDTFDKLFNELVEVKKRLDCHNGYAKKFEENSKELSIINNKLTGLQIDIDYLKSDRCKV